jgi:hypothetical protein
MLLTGTGRNSADCDALSNSCHIRIFCSLSVKILFPFFCLQRSFGGAGKGKQQPAPGSKQQPSGGRGGLGGLSNLFGGDKGAAAAGGASAKAGFGGFGGIGGAGRAVTTASCNGVFYFVMFVIFNSCYGTLFFLFTTLRHVRDPASGLPGCNVDGSCFGCEADTLPGISLEDCVSQLLSSETAYETGNTAGGGGNTIVGVLYGCSHQAVQKCSCTVLLTVALSLYC